MVAPRWLREQRRASGSLDGYRLRSLYLDVIRLRDVLTVSVATAAKSAAISQTRKD